MRNDNNNFHALRTLTSTLIYLVLLSSPAFGATMLWREDFESLPVGVHSRPGNINNRLFYDASPYGESGLGVVNSNNHGGSRSLRGNFHLGNDPITGASTDGRYALIRGNLPAGC